MDIKISYAKGTTPVTIVSLQGDLDASSYLELVNTAQMLYDSGVRNLLLDLAELSFLSSAGLASLHILAKMFRGERTDPKDDLGSHKKMGHDAESSMQSQVKLLNPSPEVDDLLDTTGFKQLFEVFSDLEEAVQSFKTKPK